MLLLFPLVSTALTIMCLSLVSPEPLFEVPLRPTPAASPPELCHSRRIYTQATMISRQRSRMVASAPSYKSVDLQRYKKRT